MMLSQALVYEFSRMSFGVILLPCSFSRAVVYHKSTGYVLHYVEGASSQIRYWLVIPTNVVRVAYLPL